MKKLVNILLTPKKDFDLVKKLTLMEPLPSILFLKMQQANMKFNLEMEFMAGK